MWIKHWLLDLFYPPKCVLCGKLLSPEQTDLCHDCRSFLTLEIHSKKDIEGISDVICAGYYDEHLRESILRYKFGGRSCYAGAYGRILGMAILRACPDYDVITWVPVSKKRKRRRGYDQAQLLAQAVAEELGAVCVPMLVKFRDIPAQSGLKSAAERRANVLGVYRSLPDAEIRGRRILLIDDVLTTGATMGEAARVLHSAGAEAVIAAVLAVTRE